MIAMTTAIRLSLIFDEGEVAEEIPCWPIPAKKGAKVRKMGKKRAKTIALLPYL